MRYPIINIRSNSTDKTPSPSNKKDMVGLRERVVRWLERCALRVIRAFSSKSSAGFATGRIIFLCTGNICRSPFAEAVAREKGAMAISCGTRTSSGAKADPVAITVGKSMGRDLSAHLTTRWEDVELRRGDIVIAMQLRHALKAYQRTFRAGVKVLVLGALVGLRQSRSFQIPMVAEQKNTGAYFH